eukprot:793545_1
MVFTTCVPDTSTRYDGTTITAHYLRVYRWDYGDNIRAVKPDTWVRIRQQPMSQLPHRPVTITAPPTWATPTANPAMTTALSTTAPSPPSESFAGWCDNTRKAIEMDTISCCIYRHDTLER